jgi:hypothetical protein
MRHHIISHPYPVALRNLQQVNLGIQVSHILNGIPYVQSCLMRQRGIIDDRRLTQPSQETVKTPGTIPSGEGIDVQRHLHQREPFVVRMLADVSRQRSRLQLILIGFDRNMIQHMLTFRNETVYAASRERKTHKQTKACKYYPPKAIHTTKVDIF